MRFLTIFLGILFAWAIGKWIPFRSSIIQRQKLSQLSEMLEKRFEFFTIPTELAVDCPKNALTIAIFGQSNSANRIPRTRPIHLERNDFYVWNWVDQKCAKYSEPILGAEGDSAGNVFTRVLEMLQTRVSGPIVIVGFGVGGTSILDWAQGPLSILHENILKTLMDQGMHLDLAIFHQGETETNGEAVSRSIQERLLSTQGKSLKQIYFDSVSKVIQKHHLFFPQAPFGLALASRCGNHQSSEVIQAQAKAAMMRDKTFITINTDLLGDEFRYDQCHFNEKGEEKIAEAYSFYIESLVSDGRPL